MAISPAPISQSTNNVNFNSDEFCSLHSHSHVDFSIINSIHPLAISPAPLPHKSASPHIKLISIRMNSAHSIVTVILIFQFILVRFHRHCCGSRQLLSAAAAVPVNSRQLLSAAAAVPVELRKSFAMSDEVCNGGCITHKTNKVDFKARGCFGTRKRMCGQGTYKRSKRS